MSFYHIEQANIVSESHSNTLFFSMKQTDMHARLRGQSERR